MSRPFIDFYYTKVANDEHPQEAEEEQDTADDISAASLLYRSVECGVICLRRS